MDFFRFVIDNLRKLLRVTYDANSIYEIATLPLVARNDIYHPTLKQSLFLKCLEEIVFLKLVSELFYLFGPYLQDLAHIRGDST